VLLEYFKRVAERRGLSASIRFQTEVQEAVWETDAALWRVRVQTRGGATATLTANAIISAVGQLNQPQYPHIPGREFVPERGYACRHPVAAAPRPPTTSAGIAFGCSGSPPTIGAPRALRI